MITDKLLRVSDSQAVSGANDTTQASTDFINLNNISATNKSRDVGMGETLYALFTINTAPTGGTSIEFQIQVGTVASNPLTPTTGTFTLTDTLVKRGGIPIANLTAGTQIILPIPPVSLSGTSAHGIRAGYYFAGTVTGAVITCDIILDAQHLSKFYPSGFVVYSA